MRDEKIMEQRASFHTSLEDCRRCYQYYSDAADNEGYASWMEDGIAQTLQVLEYLKTQADQLLSGILHDDGNSQDRIAVDGISKECNDLIKKTELLRERKPSVLAASSAGVKDCAANLFDVLFAKDWFQKYTGADNLDNLLSKGITHGVFERGKQVKLIKPFMMDIHEMDILISGLMCFYAYDDQIGDEKISNGFCVAAEEMVKEIERLDSDPRVLKAIYNKYGETLRWFLRKIGILD